MSDIKVWNRDNLESGAQYRHFPTDMLLRSIFSDRYFDVKNIKTAGSLLDIGCLYANNLMPFADRGWDLYGTEVTDESVEIAKASCDLNKINAEVRLGFNSALPFESDKFDVLLSLSTIHYEESVDDVSKALKEMSRVLRHDGCAIIQTVAPQHDIFKSSSKIGEHLYRLNMKSDLRHGQKFTFFEHSADLIDLAKIYFSTIEVARCTETYPNKCIDMWLFKLRKN